MSRKTDLEKAIRESYQLISEYEHIVRTETDSRTKARARREIAEQWEFIREYCREYGSIVGYTSFPLDIAEIRTALDSRPGTLPSDLANGGSYIQPGSDDIEFVNRIIELEILQPERLRTLKSPCTLLNAPAGYGKSYLLKHLLSDLQAQDASYPLWSFRIIDLAQQTNDQIAYIAQAITGQPLGGDLTDVVDRVCTYVVNQLAAPIDHGRRSVLLIIDAVDHLERRARQWLYTLLNALCTRACIDDQEIIAIRFIIAGRDVESFWKGYQDIYPTLPVPQRMNLTPFDRHSIQELIWQKAQAAHVSLNDRIVAQIAEEISYLGGGHPLAIRNLVNDLARQTFAIGPVPGYFAQHRGRLVRMCLSSVASSLMQNVDEQRSGAVRILSVFRRINANTVQALIEAGELPPNTTGIDLLGDMQKANLLDGPSIHEPFYRDELTRRVLALDMAYWSPQSQTQYQRLNKIARDLYKSWIDNLGQQLPESPIKTMQRLLSVVEWLFHALQARTVNKKRLLSELYEHVKLLSQGDQPQLTANLIADEIERDAEVCYLLKHRLRNDGVAMVCNRLRSWSGGV